jgi:hypothetical protein
MMKNLLYLIAYFYVNQQKELFKWYYRYMYTECQLFEEPLMK